MNDHDYDGLLAVRLGLMRGHGAEAPFQAPVGLGGSSAPVESREALRPPGPFGNSSRVGSKEAPSADARAQLLNSVKSELMRGLAAASHNGGEQTPLVGIDQWPPHWSGLQQET